MYSFPSGEYTAGYEIPDSTAAVHYGGCSCIKISYLVGVGGGREQLREHLPFLHPVHTAQ